MSWEGYKKVPFPCLNYRVQLRSTDEFGVSLKEQKITRSRVLGAPVQIEVFSPVI